MRRFLIDLLMVVAVGAFLLTLLHIQKEQGAEKTRKGAQSVEFFGPETN